MSSYQVNADELFDSDSGASSDDLPSAIQPPSPKRARRMSSFSAPSTSSLSNTSRPSSFPSFNASSSYKPRPPSQTSSFPSFSATRPSAPSHPGSQLGKRSFASHVGAGTNRYPPAAGRGTDLPRQDQRSSGRNFPPRQDVKSTFGSALGPMGRGRAATLPAHVTGSRPNPRVSAGRPAPDLTPGLADEEALKEAAAILPEHMRERYIENEKKKAALAAGAERKRPSRRRKENHAQSVMGDIKKRPGVSSAANGSMKQKPEFTLKSLLAPRSNQDTSLIRLDPTRLNIARKVKRAEAVNVYTAVSRTKESVEREERLRREEEERQREEERQEREFYEDLRERERQARKQLAAKWKRQKTVASEMRDSHFVARIEKHLFAGEAKAKADTLEYLGLRLRPVSDDERVSKLLTIEVIHI